MYTQEDEKVMAQCREVAERAKDYIAQQKALGINVPIEAAVNHVRKSMGLSPSA